MGGRNNLSGNTQLPVAVDVMGGDLGCEVAIDGAVQAARKLNITSILVGDEARITARLRRAEVLGDQRLRVQHASQVITMEDTPSLAIRGKPDSSIRVAFELVRRGEASGVVSAGNTGAMMAAGLFISGTLPGIARPAIASLIPKVGERRPAVLLDSGANVDCNAEQLVQFAIMGRQYAMSALPCENPRVALLSNGSEASKGDDLTRSAAQMLSGMQGVNFVGYVEGRDLARDRADVILCDGFVGNVVLKTIEGSVDFVINSIKCHLQASSRGRFGLWLIRPLLRSLFMSKLDPSAYGGAPLLGLRDVAVVLHGSSGKRAFFNGIRVARKFVEEDVVSKMNDALGALEMKPGGSYQDNVWDRVGQRFDGKRPKKTKPRESSKGVSDRDLQQEGEEE